VSRENLFLLKIKNTINIHLFGGLVNGSDQEKAVLSLFDATKNGIIKKMKKNEKPLDKRGQLVYNITVA